MKNFKKLMALVIAGVMVVGSMSLAGASESAYDSQIKVTGLAEASSVDFHQVLEWKESAGDYKGWSLTTAFDRFKDKFNGADDAAKRTAAVAALIDGISSEEAGWLADIAPATGKTGTLNNGEATLAIDGTNATHGLYMAVITPKDQKTVYNPVFVSSDYNKSNNSNLWNVTSDATYSDTGAAKSSTVKIDKQAEKDAGTSFDQTWTSTRIGEVVHYTVTTTIPGYGKVYTDPIFKVSDKLTDLELVAAPTVTVEGMTADDWTITGGAGAKEYTVTFKPASLLKVTSPKTVTITYDAKVTSTATMNINEEKNEVWVEYSHDPKNESDVNVEKDDTVHYTYTIDANILGGYGEGVQLSGAELVKIGLDSNGQPINSEKTWKSDVTETNTWKGALEGAKFKLYTDASCSTEYKTVDKQTFDIRSDANGRLYTLNADGSTTPGIAGLDAGSYWLREEEAPAGFIKQTDPVKFTIDPHFSEKTVTEYWDGSAWHDTDTSNGAWKSATYKVDTLDSYDVLVNDTKTTTHTFNNAGKTKIKVSDTGTVEKPSPFTNTKGVELPSTGGMGTTLFYAIGAILVLGAGILLVSKRRMSAN